MRINVDTKKNKRKYKFIQRKLSNVNRCLLRINNTGIKKANPCDPEASSLNNLHSRYL